MPWLALFSTTVFWKLLCLLHGSISSTSSTDSTSAISSTSGTSSEIRVEIRVEILRMVRVELLQNAQHTNALFEAPLQQRSNNKCSI